MGKEVTRARSKGTGWKELGSKGNEWTGARSKGIRVDGSSEQRETSRRELGATKRVDGS